MGFNDDDKLQQINGDLTGSDLLLIDPNCGSMSCFDGFARIELHPAPGAQYRLAGRTWPSFIHREQNTFVNDPRLHQNCQATPSMEKVLANLSSSEADAEAIAASSTNPWDMSTVGTFRNPEIHLSPFRV